MLPALLTLVLVFGVLLFTRVGGSYRVTIIQRWPATLLAGAAILALVRGALWPAIALASLGALAWISWPAIERMRAPTPPEQKRDTPEDSAARIVLGVAPNASDEEIRRAYRARMAQAHPDRGGSHNEAARLTAARDRLLNKRR